MEEELKKIDSSQVTLRIVTIDLSNKQINKITFLGKKVILVESDKVYLAYTIYEKDMKLEILHKKVKSLNGSARFLESSVKEKEDLINALSVKFFKLEDEFFHSKGII